MKEVLEQYCKYKRFKLKTVNNMYTMSKKDSVILTITAKKDTYILNYGDNTEESTKEDLLKYFEGMVKGERLKRRFISSSRPKKKYRSCRNKITEMGRDYIHNYTMRQNESASEAVSISRHNRRRI